MWPLCVPTGEQCPIDIVHRVESYSDVNEPNIIGKYPLMRKADTSMFDLDGMRKVGKRVANEVTEAGGHYSAFVGSGTVGHQGGDQYVREVLTHIRDLFAE